MSTVPRTRPGKPAIPTSGAQLDLIGRYVRHLHDLSRATSSIDHYTWLLRRLDRELPDGLIGACTEELRDFLHPGLSKASHENYRAIILGFFTWACDPDGEHWLDYNPCRRVPQVRVPAGVPRPVETDQLDEILTAARQPFRLWFQLAAYGGMRAVEIAGLDRSDVTKRRIRILGKGGKTRVVPTHPDVWAAVQGLPRGPIAVRRDGSQSNRKIVDARANQYLDRIGHGNVTLHMLRHWFASTTYAVSGEDILSVRDLLGHANVATTQRYIRVEDSRKDAAVEALPSLGRVAKEDDEGDLAA